MKTGFLKSTLIFLFIFVLFFAAGCRKTSDAETLDEEIIGEWTESIFNSGYIFNEDLTGEDTFWLLPFTYTTKDGILTVTYNDSLWGKTSYSYSINEDVLTMTGDSGVSFDYVRKAP